MKKTEAVHSTASSYFCLNSLKSIMLFGNNPAKAKITDRIYISSGAKQFAIMAKARNQSDLMIIAWFDESYSQMQSLLSSNSLDTEIFLAREIAPNSMRSKTVVFFEHYPLSAKETIC